MQHSGSNIKWQLYQSALMLQTMKLLHAIEETFHKIIFAPIFIIIQVEELIFNHSMVNI